MALLDPLCLKIPIDTLVHDHQTTPRQLAGLQDNFKITPQSIEFQTIPLFATGWGRWLVLDSTKSGSNVFQIVAP